MRQSASIILALSMLIESFVHHLARSLESTPFNELQRRMPHGKKRHQKCTKASTKCSRDLTSLRTPKTMILVHSRSLDARWNFESRFLKSAFLPACQVCAAIFFLTVWPILTPFLLSCFLDYNACRDILSFSLWRFVILRSDYSFIPRVCPIWRCQKESQCKNIVLQKK